MSNQLVEIVKSQKRGQPYGIASICSAHPWVIRASMQGDGTLLIESTCNQVNQFGGYTGMTPQRFAAYIHNLAHEYNFPVDRLLLGGDHLGPYVWQNEPAASAMNKATDLVRSYVQAGYTKIHLDVSMKLGGDDPHHPLEPVLIAQRTAQLMKVAETTAVEQGLEERLFYVVGSEVPTPGGATKEESGVHVTRVDDVSQMLEQTFAALIRQNLKAAWERIIALVVQPGVEFGNDFVHDYLPEAAQELVYYIETTPFVYEVHSTDYQTVDSLRNLVHDHFAILKVGPALTYAFRQAVFSLASIENELLPLAQRSSIVEKLDQAMQSTPEYWIDHYHGSSQEKALARKYSLSDRVRYYWALPDVQASFNTLLANFHHTPIPPSLVSQYFPHLYPALRQGSIINSAQSLIIESIKIILRDYHQACLPVTITNQ
jgi:D-tagatose-1,6-bisphosphate aldolase subunit GatZ/KbaZ